MIPTILAGQMAGGCHQVISTEPRRMILGSMQILLDSKYALFHALYPLTELRSDEGILSYIENGQAFLIKTLINCFNLFRIQQFLLNSSHHL